MRRYLLPIAPRFHIGLRRWLDHRPPITVVAIGLGLVAALGYADAAVAPDLAPLIYLAPVSLVAWYGGRGAGALVAAASAAAWLVTERLGGAAPPSALPGWDVAVRCGAFLVLALMVAALRRSPQRGPRPPPPPRTAGARPGGSAPSPISGPLNWGPGPPTPPPG